VFTQVADLKLIGLGGGCHWCTEGIFVSLAGVERVEQGWIASLAPHDQPSEAVIVHYDPTVITAEELLAVHLQTHSATSRHALRAKYRSAVYTFGESAAVYYRLLDAWQEGYTEPLQTQVLPFISFTASLPEHQDYYRTDPDRPFCRRYIEPKLTALRERRPELFNSGQSIDA
jgi:peptide-methionine (S)-S-oxide reductase